MLTIKKILGEICTAQETKPHPENSEPNWVDGKSPVEL
jgi:hypothetical protein